MARRACGRGRPIDPRGKSSSDPPARARAPAQGLGRPGAARCRTSVHRPGRGGGARRWRKPIDGRRRSHHANISRCQCHETVEPAEHGTAGSMALGPGTHGSTRLEASSWRLSGRQRVPVGMMERGEGRRAASEGTSSSRRVESSRRPMTRERRKRRWDFTPSTTYTIPKNAKPIKRSSAPCSVYKQDGRTDAAFANTVRASMTV